MKMIKPMEPILSSKVVNEEEYIHQIKWDGIRGLTYIDNDIIRLYTKKGHERTEFYPELKELNTLMQTRSAILDGELIILNDEMRPSFNLSLYRERVRTKSKISYYAIKYPVKYILFDILYIDGKDLRDYPLEERISILNKTVKKSRNITITDSFDNGEQLLELMKQKNYEGIVSKNRYSKYIEGKKHNDWFKTKIFKKMLALVCGIKFNNKTVKSLLLGIYSGDSIIYIGNANGSLTQKDMYLLMENINVIRSYESPFIDVIKEKDIVFLKPVITCWVSFLEWTNNNTLRQPHIIGFSKEKPTKANGKEYTYHG
ncbi:MAG: ATP-dependent DNA ligase [Vallitalea sp.]|jgi:bifunctional non-homologous end joining protein LigD|nr:ATP-dependent DNA ligase [Vallitalea sp.]